MGEGRLQFHWYSEGWLGGRELVGGRRVGWVLYLWGRVVLLGVG